jgi:predicted MFS family arabinose efflux permease
MTSAIAPKAVRTPPLWLVLAAAGTIVAISMGRLQVMGLYLVPVTLELNVGRETFGLTMALAQLLVGLAAPITGAMIDKFGAGRIIIGCSLTTMGGLYLMQTAQTGPQLIASGILMGLGVSGTGLSALVGTISRLSPPEKRTSAIASVGMAAGIGTFLAFPYAHLLIDLLGWKASLFVLMGTLALMIPLSYPLSGKPMPAEGIERSQTLRDALGEAFRHPSFWLLTTGFFVCGFHVAFVSVHLPAFAVDKALPAWVGPMALAVLGLVNILGTYMAGKSGVYVEKRVGLIIIYLGRAVVFAAFLFVPMTPVTLLLMCGLLGLLWLSTIPLTSGLVAIFFGTQWMSMLYGFVFLSHQVGSFLGVWIAGRLFDLTGSYDVMWMLSAGLGLLSALLNWPIKETPVARLAGVRT